MTTGVRRRMHVEERRRQLIGVALDLFSRRAPDEVSLDDIASAAGISRPLVYHYFPGKPGLYEAALRRAADNLAEHVAQPPHGPLGERLLRMVRSFFDFVDEHGPGLAALLRGAGPGAVSPAAGAAVEAVRHTAYRHLLMHLGTEEPPLRLELVVRSWLSLVESTALTWLDEPRAGATPTGQRGKTPRGEVERQLVQEFGALVAVAATYDTRLAGIVREALAGEAADGVFGELVGRVAALVPAQRCGAASAP